MNIEFYSTDQILIWAYLTPIELDKLINEAKDDFFRLHNAMNADSTILYSERENKRLFKKVEILETIKKRQFIYEANLMGWIFPNIYLEKADSMGVKYKIHDNNNITFFNEEEKEEATT